MHACEILLSVEFYQIILKYNLLAQCLLIISIEEYNLIVDCIARVCDEKRDLCASSNRVVTCDTDAFNVLLRYKWWSEANVCACFFILLFFSR